MNLHIGVSHGRDGDTAICGIGLTREGARACVSLFTGGEVRFAVATKYDATDRVSLEDACGDLIGSVLSYELNTPAESFCERLLNPEDLGLAVSEDIRNHARRAIGLSVIQINKQ